MCRKATTAPYGRETHTEVCRICSHRAVSTWGLRWWEAISPMHQPDERGAPNTWNCYYGAPPVSNSAPNTPTACASLPLATKMNKHTQGIACTAQPRWVQDRLELKIAPGGQWQCPGSCFRGITSPNTCTKAVTGVYMHKSHTGGNLGLLAHVQVHKKWCW